MGSLAAPVLRLPLRALGPRTGAPLTVLALVALTALLLTAAMALRDCLADVGRSGPAPWAAVVGLATLIAVAPFDPWRLLALGLGVTGAVCTPAWLASGRVAALAGSIVGAVVFVGLATLPMTAPALGLVPDVLVRYPVLVALPLGWAAVWTLDGRHTAAELRA